MMRFLSILIGAALLTSCYKDEVDLAGMTNNPFDRDYDGPARFTLIGTYVETVDLGPGQSEQQVIEFEVHEEHFLQPTSYFVHVTEQGTGITELLPSQAGSDRLKYYRISPPAFGVPICIELRLSNNGSNAGAETICATL